MEGLTIWILFHSAIDPGCDGPGHKQGDIMAFQKGHMKLSLTPDRSEFAINSGISSPITFRQHHFITFLSTSL
jgi:hypothetical protein